jgi:hypothetical protein
VSLSIVDIFLVSRFQSFPILRTKDPHPANGSNNNLSDAPLSQLSPGLTQYTGCTLSSIYLDLLLHV